MEGDFHGGVEGAGVYGFAELELRLFISFHFCVLFVLVAQQLLQDSVLALQIF